jgi:hypothetical protein
MKSGKVQIFLSVSEEAIAYRKIELKTQGDLK